MELLKQFSEAENTVAPKLEPSLEGVLWSVNSYKDVILAFRCMGVLDREHFIALDSSKKGLKSPAKEAFGIDGDIGFAYQRETAKLVKAWEQGLVQTDANMKVKVVARAHGEAVSFLAADWEVVVTGFKKRFCKNLNDSELSGRSLYEAFEEKLLEGRLKPESLAHVISTADEEDQASKNPEAVRQVGLHLDSTVTIQTLKRLMSKMLTSMEERRTMHKILHVRYVSQAESFAQIYAWIRGANGR